jgi:hypothetical protein
MTWKKSSESAADFEAARLSKQRLQRGWLEKRLRKNKGKKIVRSETLIGSRKMIFREASRYGDQ